MITNKHQLVGNTYILARDAFGQPAGTKVYVRRIDCDDDIVVYDERNVRHLHYVGDLDNFLSVITDPKFGNKWIVWCDHGSTPVNSEAEAKSKAEEVATLYGCEVYVAQAHNSVKYNALAWAK